MSNCQSMRLCRICIYAMFFIAFNALMTATNAQTVFKCGESYSQSPCPDGKALKVDDTRDPTQKAQTDEATRRNTHLANTLQKERVSQERSAMVHTRNMVKTEKPVPQNSGPVVVHKITPKRVKSKNKTPDAFVAQVPGSEKMAVRKKVTSPKSP